MKVRVGLVDDHQLFLKSLSLLINSFGNYEVVVEALNGKDLMDKMASKNHIPEIMLVTLLKNFEGTVFESGSLRFFFQPDTR